MNHMLDRPIYHALCSRHAVHAVGDGLALRYDADVAPFAAARDDSPEALFALAALIPDGRNVMLLQAEASPVPPGCVAELVADGVQMVAGDVQEPDGAAEDLGAADAPEMLALATLAKPGPFLARTLVLGGFVGFRHEGRLVAMAGERFSLPGHVEVSGVCTHPDFRGQGLAARLSRVVAHRIRKRGDTPFLHAWAGNAPAIRLYETLGFRLCRTMSVTVLRRA